MKQFKLILILLVVCEGLNVNLCAQTIIKDAITINNLKVGERYSQEQFVQAFGNPTKIRVPDKFDEYANLFYYQYGKDLLYWIDGEFYGFELCTPTFTVNGLVRVGDAIAVVDQLEGVKRYEKTDRVRLVNWRPEKGGLYDWLSVDFYYDEKGIITKILAFINDL